MRKTFIEDELKARRHRALIPFFDHSFQITYRRKCRQAGFSYCILFSTTIVYSYTIIIRNHRIPFTGENKAERLRPFSLYLRPAAENRTWTFHFSTCIASSVHQIYFMIVAKAA